MKALFFFFTFIIASGAIAGTLSCETREHKVIVSFTSKSDITLSLKGETAFADGIVTTEEVDLVARFPSLGEMTIYARVGKSDPNNYMFFQGKRNPVVCR